MKNVFLLFFAFFSLKLAVSAQTLSDCAVCSEQIIQSEQIEGLSIDELKLLINEIFARKGYQFESYRFQGYFESKPWYTSKRDNKSVQLNETEKRNVKLLKEAVKQGEAKRLELIRQIKLVKALVLAGKTKELKSKFDFHYDSLTEDYEPKRLMDVFNKIDLNDLHYYKNTGLHSTMTDNGFVEILCELSIDGPSVNLIYNYMHHSKIIEGFNEFTDYHSEEEFMYNWQFEFKNNQLKFIRLVIAG